MSQPPTPPGPGPQRPPQPQSWPQQGMPPGGPQPPPQPQSQYWPQQGMPPGGPQPPYGPVPAQQQPKKPKRFGWAALIITAVAALILGVIVGMSGDGTTTTAEPNATVTVTKTAKAESAPTASKVPEPTKTTKPESKSTMEEGTYEIGVDAQAGRYKTTVPQDSSNCYWERTKDDSGDSDSIIANDNVNPGARASITVKSGEFFKSSGCGTWTRV
jgi:hypothetical protein